MWLKNRTRCEVKVEVHGPIAELGETNGIRPAKFSATVTCQTHCGVRTDLYSVQVNSDNART